MIGFSRLAAYLIVYGALLLSTTPKLLPSFQPTRPRRTSANTRPLKELLPRFFTSKAGNTFLNIGGAYPNQTFTGWIPPASAVSKFPILASIEGKHVKITGRIEHYKGKPEIRINAASQLEVE
jgi:hypothetical protein